MKHSDEGLRARTLLLIVATVFVIAIAALSIAAGGPFALASGALEIAAIIVMVAIVAR